ncbi:MAG: metal-dependent transcriptional regulator [Erysipelotrichaceae bacterium]|nr:metal-dependent transcriptional regulator [Erysipelotrichaceae bacterium]
MLEMSIAMQNYLELIYETNLKKQKIRVSLLAEQLNVSKPSVNNALNVLKENGYLNYERYGDITLTPLGEKIAKQICNKHHVLARMFEEVFGLDSEIANEDACRIEHVISQQAIEAIENYLEGNEKKNH